MSNKKKRRGSQPTANSLKVQESKRAKTIIDIVKTDSTFKLHTFRDGATQCWVGKCIHCNSPITVPTDGNTQFTIEHIMPKCHGGDDELTNLAISCGGCNNEKGIRHDRFVGKNPRSDQVIENLKAKRMERWREPLVTYH